MRSWIVKGRPAENDLREMIVAGRTNVWRTGRPPRGWASGDRLLFWEGSPTLQLVGLGELSEVLHGKTDEDLTLFEVRYSTSYLDHPIGIEVLRAVPELTDASFLKSGPAGTVFPLDEVQAAAANRLVLAANPEIEKVMQSFAPAAPRALWNECIYTILAPKKLVAGGPFTEGKPWVKGRQMLEQATAAGRSLPIVFSDARNCQRVIGWAVATRIEIDGGQTLFDVRETRQIDGRRSQELVLLSSGTTLAEGDIRPYHLCVTPDWLDESTPLALASDATEDIVGLEGSISQVLTLHRRREQRLREAKLAEVLARPGRLACEVRGCGFDFEHAYGPLGQRYAHVHHLSALGERDDATATRLSDLAVLCANCHAMIHRGGGTRPLDEIAAALATQEARRTSAALGTP